MYLKKITNITTKLRGCIVVHLWIISRCLYVSLFSRHRRLVVIEGLEGIKVKLWELLFRLLLQQVKAGEEVFRVDVVISL